MWSRHCPCDCHCRYQQHQFHQFMKEKSHCVPPFGYLRLRRIRNCIVYNSAPECNRFFWYILVCVVKSFSGPVSWAWQSTWAYLYGRYCLDHRRHIHHGHCHQSHTGSNQRDTDMVKTALLIIAIFTVPGIIMGLVSSYRAGQTPIGDLYRRLRGRPPHKRH